MISPIRTLVSRSLLVGAATAALASAQDFPRPDVPLTTITGQAISDPRIVSPQQTLPGNPALGLAPTARVAYAIWPEDTTAGRVLQFARSVDGGWSWDASSVQTIWTTVPGEILNTFSLSAHAEGDHVFLTFLSRRDPSGSVPSVNAAWVLGSNDQGQTWQSAVASAAQFTPMPSGVDLNRVLTVNSALSAGILHVAFEADFDDDGTGASANDDNAYYQAFSFDVLGTLVPLFPNEKRLQTSAIGTNDVDTVEIAVDGPFVLVTWEGTINVESVVSQDFGNTFSSEIAHTSFSVNESIDPPENAVFGATMVVVHADASMSASSADDLLFASVSLDAGTTWTNHIPLTSLPDVQLPLYGVEITSSAVMIAWVDDASGTEELKVIADPSGGVNLITGTFSERSLITRPGSGVDFTDIDGLGDVFAIAGQVGTGGSAQDAFVVVTTDAGQSFEVFYANDFGTSGIDGDEIDVAVSANFDINVGWVADGANSDMVMTGLKVGRLFDESGTGGGLVYRGPASQAGDSVLFALSVTPPVSLGVESPTDPGYALNFSPDGLTLEVLLSPFFTRTIAADGSAVLPLPNFAALFGLDFYWVALPFDGVGLSRTYSDPLQQS
jgi:hypothetical protein